MNSSMVTGVKANIPRVQRTEESWIRNSLHIEQEKIQKGLERRRRGEFHMKNKKHQLLGDEGFNQEIIKDIVRK